MRDIIRGMRKRRRIVIPNFDLGSIPLRVSLWHVAAGKPVAHGERILEVLAGDVLMDLPAPATGVLSLRLVEEDDWLEVGQTVGWITASE